MAFTGVAIGQGFPVTVATPVNAIDHVRVIWLTSRGLRTHDLHRESSILQIYPRGRHRLQDKVIRSQQLCESGIASHRRIDFSRGTIDSVACVKHGCIDLTAPIVVDSLPR